MRLIFVTLIMALLPKTLSAEVVLDSMLVSRINTDPYASAYSQYAEATMILRERFNLDDSAKIVFSIQTKKGEGKYLIHTRFCAKSRPKKCLQEQPTVISVNNGQQQLVVRDLGLINLKKETLLQMAKLASNNDLAFVVDIHQVNQAFGLFKSHKAISQIAFDFNMLLANPAPLTLIHQDPDPEVQFQFQHRSH